MNTPDFYAGFHQENFYGMTWLYYYTVDIETGRALDYNEDLEDADAAYDMTYDATTGKVYGPDSSYDGQVWDFKRLGDIIPALKDDDNVVLLGGYLGGGPGKGGLQMPCFTTKGEPEAYVSCTAFTGGNGVIPYLLCNGYGIQEDIRIEGEKITDDKNFPTVRYTLPKELCDLGWVSAIFVVEFGANQACILDDIHAYGKESGSELIPATRKNISAGCGTITVSGFEGEAVSVYDAAGTRVAHADKASARMLISSEPGVRIVRAGDTVRKVMVK